MRKLLFAPRTIVNKFLQVPEGTLYFKSASLEPQWASYYLGTLHKSVNLPEPIFLTDVNEDNKTQNKSH